MFNPDLLLSLGALRLLRDYNWPGNIRELANLMRRAAVMCKGDTILPDHLGSRLLPSPPDSARTLSAPLRSNPDPDLPPFRGDFWEHYGKAEALEQMSPVKLNQMLHSLQGLENSLLSVMRKKGIGPPPHEGRG